MQDFVSPQAAERAMFERRVAPLKAAGIDVESNEQVIKALSHGQTSVQLAAVYVLKQRQVTAALPQLRRLMGESSPPLLALESCAAVAALQPSDESWKTPCARLLAPPHDTLIQVRAAGLFAAHRDPRGWELVRRGIESAQAEDVEEAAKVAHLFDGLEVQQAGQSTTIRVLPLIADTFATSDETTQLTLVPAIGKTAKPADLDLLAKVRAAAKSAYAKQSIETIVANVRRR
jgi:hypothetical protein